MYRAGLGMAQGMKKHYTHMFTQDARTGLRTTSVRCTIFSRDMCNLSAWRTPEMQAVRHMYGIVCPCVGLFAMVVSVSENLPKFYLHTSVSNTAKGGRHAIIAMLEVQIL